MKRIHQGVALLAIATMSLVGCGGGSGSASGGGATVAATSSTITPYKGPFYAGATVALKDASGNPITLTSGGTVNASGVISLSYPSAVTYPLIVEVTGSYYNEITGKAETTTVPLRGLISSAAGASNVPVTMVTEAAVADLQARLGTFSAAKPIPAASAVAALTAAGNMLGIPATAVPTFDPITNKTADANTLRLAAMAVIANGQVGANLADKVKALVNSLVTNSAAAPTALISQTAYNAALTAMTSGASSVMAAGATAPTPPTISTASYGTLYAAAGGGGYNTCPAGQVLNPLNLCVAAGVTGTRATSAVLAAPTGVTATAASSNAINVSWSPVTGATAYYIYRSTTAGLPVASMSKLGTALTTTFTDTTVVVGTTYYYKVVPQNIIFLTGTLVASGPASAEVSATPTVLPAAVPIAGLMGGAKQGSPLALAATVSTFAGSGAAASVSGVGAAASFGHPYGITTDGTSLFVIDTIASQIRKINIATGAVTALSAPSYNAVNPTGLLAPQDITTDGTSLYVANAYHISKVDIATGASSILAGSPAAPGSANGIGSAATFNLPYGITTDGTNVYVTEVGNNKIRQIVIATGVVTTLAGSGVSSSADGLGAAATFTNPRGITTDGTNLYVAEVGTSANVRKIVIATGAVTTVAGSPTLFGSVNGTGTAATFTIPTGITTDGTNLYIADAGAQNIRKIVIATGVVTTLAGTGLAGSIDGAGATSSFYAPSGIISDGVSLYVSDLTNNKIRKIQ